MRWWCLACSGHHLACGEVQLDRHHLKLMTSSWQDRTPRVSTQLLQESSGKFWGVGSSTDWKLLLRCPFQTAAPPLNSFLTNLSYYEQLIVCNYLDHPTCSNFSFDICRIAEEMKNNISIRYIAIVICLVLVANLQQQNRKGWLKHNIAHIEYGKDSIQIIQNCSAIHSNKKKRNESMQHEQPKSMHLVMLE